MRVNTYHPAIRSASAGVGGERRPGTNLRPASPYTRLHLDYLRFKPIATGREARQQVYLHQVIEAGGSGAIRHELRLSSQGGA